jgi:hypothetical protein
MGRSKEKRKLAFQNRLMGGGILGASKFLREISKSGFEIGFLHGNLKKVGFNFF